MFGETWTKSRLIIPQKKYFDLEREGALFKILNGWFLCGASDIGDMYIKNMNNNERFKSLSITIKTDNKLVVLD